MSLHLPPSALGTEENDIDTASDSSSSVDNDEDQTWDDWVSDSISQQPCRSLFDDKTFTSLDDVLKYDKEVYGFDLNETCTKLGLDFHGRVRLINYIRKTKPTNEALQTLTPTETFLNSDEYLIPVLEADPLLQAPTNDWSDSDDEPTNSADPAHKIRSLERQLAQAKLQVEQYHSFIAKRLNINGLAQEDVETAPTQTASASRDDDTHYFKSYGENDIHAVMIQDKVRTATYAHFILTNPLLFRDAIVLDVGCGTGILSLFAARAGAKRVIAVDASDIAEKAEKIVKANGMQDTITVIRGKIEEVSLPEDITQVDIIVSEWMGYALLYESMLDSVLKARDRFLRPGGVMAPSQCKMMLSLCDGTEIFKDRVGFWNDVYGFDLSTMTDGLYEEAIVDVVGPQAILSEPYAIKDLLIGEITTNQLDFTSPFRLVSTTDRRTKVNAFILYFDTFFTIHGHPISPDACVRTVKDGDVILAEVWPVGGKSALQRRKSQSGSRDAVTSFSTGPQSMPTHWKQTIFLLREPFTVSEGSVVDGTFHCRKSEDNSRELDMEIHYSIRKDENDERGEVIVQMYKVR